jgi:hypothetical protein
MRAHSESKRAGDHWRREGFNRKARSEETTPVMATIVSLVIMMITIGQAVAASNKAALRSNSEKDCKTYLRTDWSDQERWLWNNLCETGSADLRVFAGIVDSDPPIWKPGQILHPRFLRDILSSPMYRNILERRPIQIAGGWIPSDLELSGTRFPQTISLLFFKMDGSVDLHGSVLPGDLKIEHSTVDGDINLSNSIVKGNSEVRISEIFGNIKVNNSDISGNLEIWEAKTNQISLVSTKIDGQFVLVGSTFTLAPKSLEDRAEPYYVVFLYGSKIGQSAHLNRSVFKGPITIANSQVFGNLNLLGAHLRILDIEDSSIKGAIRLGPNIKPGTAEKSLTEWTNNSKIILKRTKIDVLPVLNDYWPKNMDIDGLKYDAIGIIDDSSTTYDGEMNIKSAPHETKAAWLLQWLNRQNDPREPYQQLRQVLLRDGEKHDADEIGYAGRNREWINAWNEGQYQLFVGLCILKVFAGFGYKLWISGIWALGFVFAGAILFMTSQEARQGGYRYGIAYSFDTLLPIIHLREKHYDIDLQGWQRYYFYLHRIMGFFLGGIIGIALSDLIK